MKKSVSIFVLVFLLIFVCSVGAYAQDNNTFYNVLQDGISVQASSFDNSNGASMKYLSTSSKLLNSTTDSSGLQENVYEITSSYEIFFEDNSNNNNITRGSGGGEYVPSSNSFVVNYTIVYTEKTINGISCGKLTNLKTNFERKDASVPMSKIVFYETSDGKMYDSSLTSLGNKTLNKQIGYINSPVSSQNYTAQESSSFSGFSNYYCSMGESIIFDYNYIGGTIKYYLTNHSGGTTTYTLDIRAFSDTVKMKASVN